MKFYSIFFLLLFIASSVLTVYTGSELYKVTDGKTILTTEDFNSNGFFINNFYCISIIPKYDCSEANIEIRGFNRRNVLIYEESISLNNLDKNKEYTVSFLISDNTYKNIDDLGFSILGKTDGFILEEKFGTITADDDLYTCRKYNVTLVQHFKYIFILNIIMLANLIFLLICGGFKGKKS